MPSLILVPSPAELVLDSAILTNPVTWAIVAAAAFLGFMAYKKNKAAVPATDAVASKSATASDGTTPPAVTGIADVDALLYKLNSSEVAQQLGITLDDVKRIFWMDVTMVMQRQLGGADPDVAAAIKVIQAKIGQSVGVTGLAQQPINSPLIPAPATPSSAAPRPVGV
jgi:hypothetical protein